MNLLPVLVWLEHTPTGDLDECPGFTNGFTYRLIGLIHSEQGFCTSSMCAKNEGCFFGPLRKMAYQANLIVVNHALLRRGIGIFILRKFAQSATVLMRIN